MPVVGCFLKILYKRGLFRGSNIISCARRKTKECESGNLTRVFTHSAFHAETRKRRATAPKENTAAVALAAVAVVVGGDDDDDEFSDEPLWHANHIGISH